MAATESTLRDIMSLTFAAKGKIQTTIKALELQLALPDLESALPAIHGLLASIAFYAEDLANDVDLACEDHATSPV
jgi:hypothetical protein